MLESRSKFACLNIDDDSDEEFTTVNKSKKSGPHGSRVGVNFLHPFVAAVRVLTIIAVVDTATGLLVQGVDENYAAEQKYREDLKRAMRESVQMTANRSPSNEERTPPAEENSQTEQHDPSLVDKILDSIEEESRKRTGRTVNEDSKGDPVVIALYRSKLTEAVEEMIKANEKAQSAQADVEKYRMKYRKLVELFRDSEVSEKAKLVMDLERARAAETDLANQLCAAQKELEQYKSKLRALGALK
ncbi:hypothetical protein NECAME_16421 [Necator americanus]|uniref:Uncharacterized protein n=1 Tax=Necator americanus TaxID=51031 RepID=W2TXC9_NECAM|nr:hypothetical protein NECAME_16421 [Necator americanus]ETN86294.1 hypothetical protein NECAME_16421 [Necator americanus]